MWGSARRNTARTGKRVIRMRAVDRPQERPLIRKIKKQVMYGYFLIINFPRML